MIVLPDNWSSSIYTLFDTNSGYASYNSNIIDNTTWMGILEPNGAVFLPITFDRVGLSYWHSGEEGLYWLATSSGNGNAYNTYFTDSGLSTDDDNGDCDRYVGRAVRLVHDANP